MDNFGVKVTAVLGSHQSEPAESKSFTFNVVKTTDVTCKCSVSQRTPSGAWSDRGADDPVRFSPAGQLDFPPVVLTAGDSGPTVSFDNPFHFYKELKTADKPESASFVFNVASDAVSSSPFPVRRPTRPV